MSRRVGTYYDVRLHGRGYSHYVPHAGGGYTDTVRDMAQRRQNVTPYFNPVTYGLTPLAGQQGMAVSSLQLGKWAAATATPFLDLVQAATLHSGYYTFAGGTWLDWIGPNGERMMHQREGTPDTRGFCTNWTFPPDPIFCVAFYRTETNNNWTGPATDAAFYTMISFGGSDAATGTAQFRLYIPYGQGGPEVHGYNDTLARYERLPLVEGSQPLGAIGAQGGQELVYLWVTVARDAIWVSTDGFKGQTAGYLLPEYYLAGDGAEVSVGRFVLSGPVRVTHVGGAWGANVYPIWMPRSTLSPAVQPTLQGPAHEFGYAVASNPYSVQWATSDEAVLSDPDGSGTRAILSEVSIALVTTGAYSRAWKATLAPVAWTNAGVTTYVSPLLNSVQIWQKPNVVTYAGAAPTSTVATDVREVTLTYPGVGKPTTGRIVFENAAGTYSGLLDYQRVAIKLGTKYSGTTSTTKGIVFSGYVRTPGGRWGGFGQPQQAEAYLFDAMTRLDDLRAVGDEPDPSLMTASDAVGWYLARGMVASGNLSGNAGTGLMTAGYVPEDSVLAPRLGQPYREVVNRLLAKGPSGATGGGLMYLRYTSGPTWERWAVHGTPFTGTGVSWALKETKPADHGSSVFHVYDLTVDKRAPAQDGEWANLVAVRGKTAAGVPIVAYAVDTDGSSYNPAGLDFGGGWHHVMAVADETLQTQEACNAAALAKLSQVNTLPQFVTVVTDFLSGAQYGQVFSLTGPATGRIAKAGVARAKFRIEEFEHRAQVRTLPKTTLTGRWIGSMAP